MFDVIKEALRAADEGTVEYMVEEQQREIAEQQRKLDEQKKTITEQSEQIAEQSEKLARHVQQMSDMEKENQKLREALAKANIVID